MRILVIGDAIIDHYYYGLVQRQSPEDPTIPVVDYVEEEYRLGGCLNVAANIKALAKRDDEVYVSSIMSRFTANMLKEKKISYDEVVFASSEKELHKRELIKTRVVNSDSHKQIARLDNRLAFHPGDVQRYRNKCFFFNGKNFDAIVVSDYNKGLVDDFIIQKLAEFDGPIFVDTKNPDFSRWLPIREKTIFKLNHKEWRSVKWPEASFTTVVTNSESGAFLIISGCHAGDFPTEPVQQGDPIGAGDVFLASFVVKYMENGARFEGGFERLGDAIKYANKAARKSVQKFGTTEVKRNEIND